MSAVPRNVLRINGSPRNALRFYTRLARSILSTASNEGHASVAYLTYRELKSARTDQQVW